MGHVTVSVNGRKYKMSCSEGAERRVSDLAGFIDGLVQDIKGGYRNVQEERLYLMAALILSDQLFELRDELQTTLAQMCNLRSFQATDSTMTYVTSHDVARIVDASSKRLQALEQKLARTGTG